MTSHEFARMLRQVEQGLLARPEFELPNYQKGTDLRLNYFGNKEGFLAAVRAVGAGTKAPSKINDGYLDFIATFGDLTLQVNRNAVCRLVQEAKYECEPLLTAEEESQVGNDEEHDVA